MKLCYHHHHHYSTLALNPTPTQQKPRLVNFYETFYLSYLFSLNILTDNISG